MKNMNKKMVTNTYLSTNESKKQNKQAEQKHSYIQRTFLQLPDGTELGVWVKKVKGLKVYIGGYRIVMGI